VQLILLINEELFIVTQMEIIEIRFLFVSLEGKHFASFAQLNIKNLFIDVRGW
jgi:hypothetical protein